MRDPTPPPSPPPRPAGDADHNGRDPSQPATGPSRPGARPGLRALLRYFLGLGTWGFGGPIATVGYMQRDLVERRGWLGRQEFLNGVALGQTMPGPLAAQVAMWVGYLERGPLGAFLVAIPFIAPSFALVVAVAAVYVRYQGLAVVQSLFYGIAPGVMAIIAIAAVKLARLTNRRDPRLWAISLLVGAVIAITGAEIAVLFIAAGLVMIALDARPKLPRRPWHRRPAATGVPLPPTASTAALGLGTIAGGGTLLALALFFGKAGAFIFGSGIGYLVKGLAGALVATAAIFTPIYLGVVLPGRWFLRHTDNPQVKAFVTGATAAAAGAIAGATVVLTRQAVTDLPTAAIALASLGLLWRFKVKEPLIVLGGAIVGLLLH